MNIFDDYTHSVIESFIACDVEFLIVGGYAVNFHGFRRTTGDVDIWMKPDNANKQKVVNALRLVGIEDPVLGDLEKMDFTKHLLFTDGEDPFKIDFMTYISGVIFEEAFAQKINTEIEEMQIPFINMKHLVLSKINTGRTKDKLDIEELQKIEKNKN